MFKSFHAVKNLTTAEGGAVVWLDKKGLDNDWLYEQYQLYSLHGQNKDAAAKLKPGAWEYDIIFPAYKCNMTDLTAALGLKQLERFDDLMARRQQIAEIYDKSLTPLGLQCLRHNREDRHGNYHLYLVRIPGITAEQRNDIIIRMAEQGISCNVHFKPLPMMKAYRDLGFDIKDYPNASDMYKNEISLDNVKLNKAWNSLKYNYQYPLYQMPTSFVNHFMDSAITFVILALYTSQELGIYSLVIRILAMPLSFIGTSLRQLSIFQFSRSNDYAQNRRLYIKMAGVLAIVIIFPFAVLYVWGEAIFTFVFGKAWAGSGRYIQALSIVYIVKFIAYPLSSVAIVYKKQYLSLAYQILIIGTVFVSYFVSKINNLSIIEYLIIQSLMMSTIYIAQSINYYLILKRGREVLK